MSEIEPQKEHKRPFSLLRILLSFYFLIYTYIVAQGMIPLPDQPARINFFAVFCVTMGLVIAFHCLASSYRLFLIGIWAFMPFAIQQLNGKIRFLEMMLEPRQVQVILSYSLYGVLVMLLTPKVLLTFNKPVREYNPPRNLLLQKGMRY